MNDTPLRHRLGLDQSPTTSDMPLQRRLRAARPMAVPLPDIPTHPIQLDHSANDAYAHTPVLSVRNIVKDMLETAIFIVLIFLIVRGIVQNFKIEGSSMEPSLHSGQYILVNKLIYFNFDVNAPLRLLPGNADLPPRVIYPFHQPQRGDIVVFEYPGDVRKDYIKRVIGLPGETIEIRDGSVYVNGQLLDEPYLQGAVTICSINNPCSQGPVVVPHDAIFVMGDNRSNSSDSREWDALPLDHVIGQAWILYYPVSDWGVVPHRSYAIDR